MGFWGVEVKPGKPQPYCPQKEQGKLHVTQATLGSGLGKEKSVIKCSIGDKTPIYLCSLLPNKNECCPLNLEFDDDDEDVEFSVTGDRSIHLSGYMESYEQECEEEEDEDEDDSDGIDIGESESNESSDYDSEEDHMDELENFIDSNLEMYRRSSSLPNSGVVIEEIEHEEKPAKESKTKQPKKKSQAKEDENAKKQIIAKESAHVPVLESEDEDGFPISREETPQQENKTGEKMDLDNDEQGSNKKRKSKDSEQESVNKNKKKKNQRAKKTGENASNEEADEQVQTENVQKKQESSQISSTPKAQTGTVINAMSESSKIPDKSAEKKNKKKNKKNSSEEATTESKTISSSVEKQKPVSVSKSSHERTYPNGLIVEELGMGKPDGKKATPGKQVSVRYIGKLQKNGKIFDSNIGKSPFKFRLGVGQVIKGWDVGVNGMRVGDKRKLTIPPAMGYGDRGAGGQIPPNAWLVFDVELIDVR